MIFPPRLILGNGLLSRIFTLCLVQMLRYYIALQKIFFGFAAANYRGPVTGDQHNFLKK
jgi:hypothetical protein